VAIFLSIWELVGELMGLFEIVSIRVYGEEELERRLTTDTDIILGGRPGRPSLDEKEVAPGSY
jgi:hypothetical protein